MATNNIPKEYNTMQEKYLLGKESDGTDVYLRLPSWDCGWYWGAGYIATINSHEHWDSGIVGKSEDAKYGYIHHINESPRFESTPLTDKESWELSEVMKTIYVFKELAEVYYMGGSHITKNPCKELIQNKDEYIRINTVILPALFKEVHRILAPKGVPCPSFELDKTKLNINGGK